MIYQAATPERLALVRVLVFCLWLWELVRDPFERLARLPQAWFQAHGPWLLVPASLFSAIWDETVLAGLRGLTLGCVAMALLGVRRQRMWALIAAAFLTLSTAFVRGFGHVDHGQVQLLVVTWVLALTPAWSAFAVSPLQRPRPGPDEARLGFSLLAVVFAFPYFETAAHRLAREGVAMFWSPSIQHFMVRDSLVLDDFAFELGPRLAQQASWIPLFNLAFAAVTVAELLAPLAHLKRSLAIGWLAVMFPFHLLSPVLMHVSFADNLVLMLTLYAWPLSWKSAPETQA
jgi:hypothetical protein